MTLRQADTGSATEEVKNRRPTPKDFRPDIEGLRGFTLLAILGFHAEVNETGIAGESAATAAGGGQNTDLTELFCATDLCPVIVGNTLVYMDETHTTLEYSHQLAPVMGALTDRALAHN